jgi:hypothetical protein
MRNDVWRRSDRRRKRKDEEVKKIEIKRKKNTMNKCRRTDMRK